MSYNNNINYVLTIHNNLTLDINKIKVNLTSDIIGKDYTAKSMQKQDNSVTISPLPQVKH